MGNTIPFPQANDLERVMTILDIEDPDSLNEPGVIEQLIGDLTSRQADYYLNACRYLGFIEADSRAFTSKGAVYRSKTIIGKKAELIRAILSDPVFGNVYFTSKLLGIKPTKEDASDMIVSVYPELADATAVLIRRGSTVVSWCRWIENQLSPSGELD